MHKYLSAIGFSKIKKRNQYENLVKMTLQDATHRAYTTTEDDVTITTFYREFAPGIGLAVVGEYDGLDDYAYDYSFPFIKGSEVSSVEEINVQRHIDKDSFSGVSEDVTAGVTLIFYLQNIVPYIRAKNTDKLPIKGTTLSLSALSIDGTIVMPVKKDARVKAIANKANDSRNRLLEAARNGDEGAIESLTFDEMDTYTSIATRIQTEDIFTIVETYFMPYGVECDLYSILGEILEVSLVENNVSKEQIYRMKIFCNEMRFDLCINKEDLFGEPQVGRRFKGVIWLQGCINFPKE